MRTVRNVIPPEKPWAIPVTKVRKDTRGIRQTIVLLDDAEDQEAAAIPRFETVIPTHQDIQKAVNSATSRLYEYGDTPM